MYSPVSLLCKWFGLITVFVVVIGVVVRIKQWISTDRTIKPTDPKALSLPIVSSSTMIETQSTLFYCVSCVTPCDPFCYFLWVPFTLTTIQFYYRFTYKNNHQSCGKVLILLSRLSWSSKRCSRDLTSLTSC